MKNMRSTEEIRQHLIEQKFLNLRNQIIEALDKIACWEEGEYVTSSFEEPRSAQIARDILEKVRGKQHDV